MLRMAHTCRGRDDPLRCSGVGCVLGRTIWGKGACEHAHYIIFRGVGVRGRAGVVLRHNNKKVAGSCKRIG